MLGFDGANTILRLTKFIEKKEPVKNALGITRKNNETLFRALTDTKQLPINSPIVANGSLSKTAREHEHDIDDGEYSGMKRKLSEVTTISFILS